MAERILEVLARLELSAEAFCRLCDLSRDDLHAIDEGAAQASVRVAAMLKLVRYCGREKLRPIAAMLEQEEASREWREVPDFPAYEVSDDGLVRRRTPHAKGAIRTLKRFLSSDGYLRVTLYRGAGPEPQRVHRLVCHAFHGAPPEDRPHALHRNGIKTDIHEGNLYWGTPVENAADWQRERRERITNAVHTPYTPAWRKQRRQLESFNKRQK